MRLRTFRGGVHAPDRKEATRDKPIEVLPPPSRVVIPLQQHTGAPCEALVKEGDTVALGQKIGDSKSFVSAPVHASIAGKVTAVQPLPHPAVPRPVLSVVIEAEAAGGEATAGASAQAQPAAGFAGGPASGSGPNGWQSLDSEEIKRRIREAGVVGLGGAAFPTHVKLSPSADKPVDALILNGVECEPYLTNDHRLMLERGGEILEGARIVMKVLGVHRACLGIEANKLDAIRHMRELAAGTGVEVVGLKVKYPQGAEKQLIKAVLGREVPSGGLPFDVGVVVQNVGTVLAVLEAVTLGKPLIERVLTVSGDGVGEPKNLQVRIGTSFAAVLEACGGAHLDGQGKVLMGGPMMGIAQYSLQVPVIKGTSGILAFRRGRQEKETACIKCGRCVEVCPMGLMPMRIADYAERDDFAKCVEYGVKDCIECGACAFACGSKRPLVHWVKYAKWNLARKK
jgi:electron transport complex protein RnfC